MVATTQPTYHVRHFSTFSLHFRLLVNINHFSLQLCSPRFFLPFSRIAFHLLSDAIKPTAIREQRQKKSAGRFTNRFRCFDCVVLRLHVAAMIMAAHVSMLLAVAAACWRCTISNGKRMSDRCPLRLAKRQRYFIKFVHS